MAYDATQLQTYHDWLVGVAAGPITGYSNWQILDYSNAKVVASRESIPFSEFLEKAANIGVLQKIIDAQISATTSAVHFMNWVNAVQGVVDSFDIDKTAIGAQFDDLVTDGVMTAGERTQLNALADVNISRVNEIGLPDATMIDVRRAKQL